MEGNFKKIYDTLKVEDIIDSDASEHTALFLLCRLLDNNLCDKLNVPLKFTFDNMIYNNDGSELGSQEQFDKLYRFNNRSENLVNYLINNDKLPFNDFEFKLIGIYQTKAIFNSLKNIKDVINVQKSLLEYLEEHKNISKELLLKHV